MRYIVHMHSIRSTVGHRCRQLPGARAVIAQHCPQVKYSPQVFAKYKAKGHTACSALFGKQVDNWLEQAVHHGWLDWGASECDMELQMALAAKDQTAWAAQAIWQALVSRGFVAVHCQETVPSLQLGVAPVLDLRGYNALGDPTIVEVKCGWAHCTSKGDLQLFPPYEQINCNHHNLALLQLAMQVHCIQELHRANSAQSLQSMKPDGELKLKNAWLLTLGTTSDPTEFETALYHLNDDIFGAAKHMVTQLQHARATSQTM